MFPDVSVERSIRSASVMLLGALYSNLEPQKMRLRVMLRTADGIDIILRIIT